MRQKRLATSGALFLATVLVSSLALVGCSSSSGSSTSTTGQSGSPTTGSLGADPANQSAGDPSQGGYTPTGTLLADDGFRPQANGFGTQNYGDVLSDNSTPVNLTATQMQKFFGTGVCVDPTASTCTLNPEAQAWMDKTNTSMAGGHCFGFSVAAQLFWTGTTKPSDFGGSTTPSLTIPGNTALQQDIAYTWAFQTLDSVNSSVIKGTPVDIVNKLKSVLQPNPTETYTVAIFKRDGTGGHAVTPYAIEDAGGGINNILIYDNNYPGITRKITVDTNANTWQYNAAINPSSPSELYEGDATTMSMSLYPTTPGLASQPNPFGGKAASAASGSTSAVRTGSAANTATLTDATTSAAMDQIWLSGSDTGHGHLVITDDQGHRLGIVNGTLVNEIPGAQVEEQFQDKDWQVAEEPNYYVPDGTKFTVSLDGTNLKKADQESVGVIGPSFDMAVDNINLQPGEKDTLDIGADATHWTYTASTVQSPEISLGVSDDTADYTFDVKGDSVPAGGTTTVDLPGEGGSLTLGTAASAGKGNFTIAMERDDADTGQVSKFSHSGISLAGGDMAELQFGQWTPGGSIPLVITQNGAQHTESLSDAAA
jgi:hypothetical protein